MANPIGKTPSLISVPLTGKVALVTLITSDDSVPTEKLKEQLRRELESSSIPDTWKVEKVTVLDDPQLVQPVKPRV